MKFDNIISNPPFGSIGTDVAKFIVDKTDYLVYLGTPSMIQPNTSKFSAKCVYIDDYFVDGFVKFPWCHQTVWMAYPGKCRYIPKKTKLNTVTSPYNIRVGFSMHIKGWNVYKDRNVLTGRNPKTSDILNLESREAMEEILTELTAHAPENHVAMLKYGFMANFVEE